MNTVIKNGFVIDPASGITGVCDIFIKDGVICTQNDFSFAESYTSIDASGLWVTPGLFDMHVHLREPGQTHKEDILTGAAAAAAGGFTGVLSMPNTTPPADNINTVNYITRKAKDAACRVYVCAAVTMGMEGKRVTDIPALVKAGITALSEDGKSVADSELLKTALALCKQADIPMLSHCEAHNINSGAMNEGTRSVKLGISGQSSLAETACAERDIALAEQTGARLHICHVSAKETVSLIREAKKRGLPITAEAAPHHFILTEDNIDGTNANYKMNPPLRAKADVNAVTEGLADGTIDCIATDHAPHAEHEKTGFERAAFGIIGLETAVSLAITYLIDANVLTPLELIKKMSLNPSAILKTGGGTLLSGKPADITIIDPKTEYTINPAEFKSKARNTPFGGFNARGRVMYTIVNGRITYKF